MAKMFYTLEEVCEKLDKSEDELKDMVRTGQVQEFRDRDKLMFKVEQIDLLAGGDEEDTSDVHLELDDTSGGSGVALQEESGLGLADSREGLGLADSREGLGLADSREGPGLADSREGPGLADSREALGLTDSREGIGLSDSREGIGLSDSREGTGVSVFDTDHGGEEGEQTAVGDAIDEELGLDAVGSGSGLLDLTRESDDTSLGAELLEEVYSSDENVEIPAHASGLFEAAGADKPAEEAVSPSGGVTMPVMIEAYDGTGSGLGAGLLIGALVALVCVAILAIVGVNGATPMLATKIAASSSMIWMWAGGLLGVTIVLGLVGLFIGKASE